MKSSADRPSTYLPLLSVTVNRHQDRRDGRPERRVLGKRYGDETRKWRAAESSRCSPLPHLSFSRSIAGAFLDAVARASAVRPWLSVRFVLAPWASSNETKSALDLMK